MAHDRTALWKEDVCNKHTGQDKTILTKPSEAKSLWSVAQNPTVLSEESLQLLPVHGERKKDGHLITKHPSFCLLFSRGLHLHLVHVKTVRVNPQVKHGSFFSSSVFDIMAVSVQDRVYAFRTAHLRFTWFLEASPMLLLKHFPIHVASLIYGRMCYDF